MTRPKPTAAHQQDGTYRKHRHAPQQPTSLGRPAEKPPGWIRDETAIATWKRLVPVCHWLTSLDEMSLSMYCQLVADIAADQQVLDKQGSDTVTAAGGLKSHPAVARRNSATQLLLKIGDKLGLSPSSRAALRVDAAPLSPDPLQKFLDGGGGVRTRNRYGVISADKESE